jgi:hypothetical protein
MVGWQCQRTYQTFVLVSHTFCVVSRSAPKAKLLVLIIQGVSRT